MIKLSNRIQFIFDQLLPGKPVWDLCCDHGYLGLQAYRSGLFPEVCFVDQVPTIITALKSKFLNEYPIESQSIKVNFISSPGEEITHEIHGSLVIAGVGAHTIVKILESLCEKGLLRAEKLILSPQRHEHWLEDEILKSDMFCDYQLMASHELRERGRLRKLLIFQRI